MNRRTSHSFKHDDTGITYYINVFPPEFSIHINRSVGGETDGDWSDEERAKLLPLAEELLNMAGRLDELFPQWEDRECVNLTETLKRYDSIAAEICDGLERRGSLSDSSGHMRQRLRKLMRRIW